MTGVEWACTLAYARKLPGGPTRRLALLLCLRHTPARPGLALSTAAGTGLIQRGRVTARGEALALSCLRREGLGL